MAKDKDDKFVSPGSIGGKIRKFRELRGWSQQKLGERCGFTASTAGVRITQYEKNTKIPKDRALKDIAAALEIDESALIDIDTLPDVTMYHLLFEMEDFHGLHPVKKGDDYYLEFGGETVLGQYITKFDFRDFLQAWYDMRERYRPEMTDTPEEKEAKKNEYALWKGEYPSNATRELFERLRDATKERHLQAELDRLYAKRNADSEIQRLEKALESVMPAVRADYKPIKSESDLVFLILEVMEKGLPVRHRTPEDIAETGYDRNNIHLLSIKTEDITESDDCKRLYARLVCAIETLQQNGIQITRHITSKEKELFVTYKYLSSEWRYFANLQGSWEDINYIIERRSWLDKEEIDGYKEKIRNKITGVNDVLLIKKVGGEDNQEDN